MLILFLLLQYRIWIGAYGVSDTHKINQEIERQRQTNLVLKQRNQLIDADIKDLKFAHESIEEHARNELGLIKDGETFFRLVEQQAAKQ